MYFSNADLGKLINWQVQLEVYENEHYVSHWCLIHTKWSASQQPRWSCDQLCMLS